MDKKTRDLYKFLDDLTSEAKISAPKEFEILLSHILPKADECDHLIVSQAY